MTSSAHDEAGRSSTHRSMPLATGHDVVGPGDEGDGSSEIALTENAIMLHKLTDCGLTMGIYTYKLSLSA